MSDFLTQVVAGGLDVLAREVKIGEKTGTVHFRRVTAGQRQQLLRGQKVTRQGGSTNFELDLALNEEQQQRLVLFSVCQPDGKPFFKDLEAVKAVDSVTVGALYKVAAELNAVIDEDKAKKA